jgi:hypothetical protein
VPAELIEPVPVTTTPPTPRLPLSATKPKLEATPVVVNAPFTIMLRFTERVVAEEKFTVPKVKSKPLPCSVILPGPTTGDAFNAVPPPMVNTPPVPVPEFKTLLTTNAVMLFGFAAEAEIAPPFELIAPLIVKTRAVESGVNVLSITPPPAVLIAPVIVVVPVLVILTAPVPLLCVTLLTTKLFEVFVKLIAPLVAFVAAKLETVLAPFNVVPPTELVVNAPADRAPV